jgi:hypothetical protein
MAEDSGKSMFGLWRRRRLGGGLGGRLGGRLLGFGSAKLRFQILHHFGPLVPQKTQYCPSGHDAADYQKIGHRVFRNLSTASDKFRLEVYFQLEARRGRELDPGRVMAKMALK